MSAFRDAIAADAILAMPEMQAIKATLVEWAHSLAHGCNDDVNHGPEGDSRFRHAPDEVLFRRWVKEAFGEDFPHVADWVLDE